MSDQPQPVENNQPPNNAQPQPLNPPPPPNSVNVNNLGYFLDGWADLIEGMGEQIEEVH